MLRLIDTSSKYLYRTSQLPRRSLGQHSNAWCEDHPELEADQYSCFGQDGNVVAIVCTVCCEDVKVHDNLRIVHQCCTLTRYDWLLNLDCLKCRWLLLPSAITEVMFADYMLRMVMRYKTMQCPTMQW